MNLEQIKGLLSMAYAFAPNDDQIEGRGEYPEPQSSILSSGLASDLMRAQGYSQSLEYLMRVSGLSRLVSHFIIFL